MLPVALDAMGGDAAPEANIEGAHRAVRDNGVPVLLVGDPDVIAAAGGDDLPVLPASEVITMDDDPASAVRLKRDSSLNVAARAVRDGVASAMVSAGNTGATMGAALLRMGRIKGVSRPAIATPLPRPLGGHPTLLLDAGANAECQPSWLVQFAQMGAVLARHRFGVAAPTVAMLSIGEEKSKGNDLVKEAHALLAADGGAALLAAGATFVGNVEGRDLLVDAADVVVCDGFTGNVALKTLEGGMKTLVTALFGVFETDEATKAAADVLLPHLLPLYGALDPNNTGGALLLGVDGVCIISHGSSNATAVANAIGVAADAVQRDLVGALRTATVA
ncbi:MAG: phosphate acyltransferase PlsX [Acidimicrobiia bacterium]|nr:phosphate acyltransferase PlsX [Acidimicrobiia bacterium]